MTEIKYTKDGKKVIVLGKLNSEESIVQEVFVSDGQEIPGGENFVAKGLLDQPAESWKEKRLRETEQTYDRRMKEIEREFRKTSDRLKSRMEKARLRASEFFHFSDYTDKSGIETLEAFYSGAITHFFLPNGPKIATWDDDDLYQFSYHGRKVEAIKLISLFGTSKGDLMYRLHQYSDGSGGLGEHIYPCSSYEEALTMAQMSIDHLSREFLSGERKWIGDMDKWRKIKGIVIPQELEDRLAENAEKHRQEKIEKLRAELAELEKGEQQ